MIDIKSNRYTELKDILSQDKELLFELLKLMLLKPSHNLHDNSVLNFYCSKHTFPTITPGRTYPSNASFYMDNMTYVCHACKERGYDNKGNIYDLTRFTYGLTTYPLAYDKVKALLKYYDSLPKVLRNSWGEEYTLPTLQDYIDFSQLLRDGLKKLTSLSPPS